MLIFSELILTVLIILNLKWRHDDTKTSFDFIVYLHLLMYYQTFAYK